MAASRTNWHTMTVDEVGAVLRASPRGLSTEEADRRRADVGSNVLDEIPPPSLLTTVLHQFRSPLISILLVAAAVTLLLGEHLDATVIAAVLLLNATIGTAQERRAERSVRALQQLVSPRARVLREGREHEVDSTRAGRRGAARVRRPRPRRGWRAPPGCRWTSRCSPGSPRRCASQPTWCQPTPR